MLYRTLHPYILFGFKKGAEQAKTKSSRAIEDEYDYQVLYRLRQKSFYHAALVIGTTKEELQSILEQGLVEELSVQQVAKNINDYFKLQSRNRSLVIARTELTDTINDGTLHTLQREGHSHKEWITNLDGRERETHAAANGQVVGIHESFIIGGSPARHPGDDSLPPGERIQCRCRLVSSGLPDASKAAYGKLFLRTHGSLEPIFVLALAREFVLQRRRILAHFPSP